MLHWARTPPVTRQRQPMRTTFPRSLAGATYLAMRGGDAVRVCWAAVGIVGPEATEAGATRVVTLSVWGARGWS